MTPLAILSSSRCTQFSAILDSTVGTRSCASFGGFWKKFTHAQRVALVPTRFSVRQSFSSVSGCFPEQFQELDSHGDDFKSMFSFAA